MAKNSAGKILSRKVTQHAVDRFRERVINQDKSLKRKKLSSSSIAKRIRNALESADLVYRDEFHGQYLWSETYECFFVVRPDRRTFRVETENRVMTVLSREEGNNNIQQYRGTGDHEEIYFDPSVAMA